MRHSSHNFFKTACYFESSLILIAIIIGWLTDIDPFLALYFSETAVFYGIIGTLPLLLLLLVTEYLPLKSLETIKNLLLKTLGENLHEYHWTDLLVLATIAGVSEEILFRGTLQPWLEQNLGFNNGLIISCVIFGLVHAVTPLYAILAGIISFYLGIALDFGENRNLLTPIIIHSLYDFFAFIVLMRSYSKENPL